MATTRHGLVDLTQPAPHPVIDVDVTEIDPEDPDFPVYHDTETHRWIQSNDVEVGWTWTEEEGLKAP